MTEIAGQLPLPFKDLEDEAPEHPCARYVPYWGTPGCCGTCYHAIGSHSPKAGGPSGVGAMP